MKIRILDDLHWKEIYEDLKILLPWFTYPIKKDVKDPMPYLEKIKNWDIILLDNYFDWWEWPLWNDFLEEYLKKNLNCMIVSISDFWEKLIDKFENWEKVNKKGDVIWWITTKKWKDIWAFLKKYLNK